MKTNIAIFGSTGSIGDNTLEIIRKDKKNFNVFLLTANNNYKKLIKQIIEFKPKNIIIYNDKYYSILKKKFKRKKIKVFSRKTNLNKIFKKKIDYAICGIAGLEGLKPTLDVIKFTKTLASANKESIMCGWHLIKKELKKYKTKFIPVDSEHFSIWNLTKNSTNEDIEEIILTASGGPLLKLPARSQKIITPAKVIRHPNWKMGKKISVDSANLMNKIFEIIEANRMFNFDLKKYKILIHPQSYVHAIIKFKNGLIKMLLHDVDMKIPIFNSIYDQKLQYIPSKKIDPKILNSLNFYKVDKLKFPSIKILKKISNKSSLFDTVITIANEELVSLFLQKKIPFAQIVGTLTKIINSKEFKKYYSKKPSSINKIYKVSKLVRLKTNGISV